jgi:multidrug efflux pump subunit AcrA (membrane-fusion protein)
MRRKVCIAVVAVALVCLVGAGLAQQDKVAPKVDAQPKQNESAVAGKTQPVAGMYSKFGPNRNAPVRRVHVKIGDPVTKGAALVSMEEEEGDVKHAEAALASAEKQEHVAQVSADLAQHELEATERLHKGKVVSETEVKMFDLKYHEAKAKALLAVSQIEEKKALLKKAAVTHAHYTVHAKTSGTVISLHVAPGQVGRIAPDISWGEILDISELNVECSVPDDLMHKVALNQKVTVRSGKIELSGEVTTIGKTHDAHGFVPVIVHVKNDGEKLRCFQKVTVVLE